MSRNGRGKSGKGMLTLIIVIFLLAFAGVYYYITLPAINIHSVGFWAFVISLAVLAVFVYIVKAKIRSTREARENGVVKVGVLTVAVLVAIFVVGALLSSTVVNAKKYQEMMIPQERQFEEDFQQVKINFQKIPLLDRDSAELLGNRKMGSIVEMVSQFEVSDLYSQINYQGTPVRVSPLVYASPIKWLTNQSSGIPAYMMVDMSEQETTLVKLDQPIRYSQSEYFNRNIYRHLRFKFPTYIFDQISFEIDDNGVPYWVCPVQKYTIGLFGGQTIGRVVLCNAQTGEVQDYAVEDCPQWVDRVYPADLLLRLYNYHGVLQNGYFNSIFGQKGCLQTTEGYNYIALEDDVWVYTGITSVNADESNVGFLLINQRTMETRYYAISGAEEFSAMASAEGQVQNLGYRAAFPLLMNVANEPTYIMALKDDAGLVKKFAMVNVQKYQNVAIGDTISDCQAAYVKLLKQDGTLKPGVDGGAAKSIRGKITRIAQSVIDGNSHFYVVLAGCDEIFDLPITEFVEIIGYEVGDTIELEYLEGDPLCTVTALK